MKMAQAQFQPVPLPTPIITARGVQKSFRMGDSKVQVLKDASVTIGAGEFLAIEGRSGSGKSTLLHIMGALDQCDEGSVLYDGKDLAKLGSAERSRLRNTQFGFVFQFYHLLPELSVLENTLLGPMIEFSWFKFMRQRGQLRQKAREVLARLGLEHRLRHRPNQLSGGERQRVAIARALMNSPRVLFADEPTGNLDAETGQQIMGVLEELHRQHGQTVIMVTHDRALARRADRVLVLRNGVLESAE